MNVFQGGLADTKYPARPAAGEICRPGWLWRKVGRGFYDYRGGAPVPSR